MSTGKQQLLLSGDRGHLAYLLLGANPGTAPGSVPQPLRFTELAGRPVAMGECGPALERLAAGDAAGILERRTTPRSRPIRTFAMAVSTQTT